MMFGNSFSNSLFPSSLSVDCVMQLEAFLMLQVTNLIWGKHIVIHVVVYGQKLFIHLSPLITGSILCWCVGQKKVSSSKLDDLKTKFEAVQIFKFKTSPDKNQRIFGTAPKIMSPYWLPITMVFENFGWCEYCNLGRGCVLMVPVGAWEWMAELAKPSVGSNLWCTGTRFPKRYGRLYTMAYSLDINKH